MRILHVVGARPNFMKAAPVMRALAGQSSVEQTLVHTGQHYDANMSDVFFQQLNMRPPDVNLGVNSTGHARQTAEIMSRLEPVVLKSRPDLVLVYGDVNSTVAAALMCVKLLVPVGHVEAGLRSFDRTMPEEINRLLTDQIADLLFTPSADADENLGREGIPAERVHLVGNVMIDTLVTMLPEAEARWKRGLLPSSLPANLERFGLVTLHRPSNVDNPAAMDAILEALWDISVDLPLIFPIHPRTRRQLERGPGARGGGNLRIVDPLSYLDFLALQCHATLAITDSGGIQEETTYLGVPCVTVRGNTERPITVTIGTNIVVGQDMERLKRTVKSILDGKKKSGQVPPLWDGRAAERIAGAIAAWRRAG